MLKCKVILINLANQNKMTSVTCDFRITCIKFIRSILTFLFVIFIYIHDVTKNIHTLLSVLESMYKESYVKTVQFFLLSIKLHNDIVRGNFM